MEMIKLHPLERLPDDFKDHDGLEASLDQRPVAPDQFIDGYEAIRAEVWAFYAFYIGNSGLGLYLFVLIAL